VLGSWCGVCGYGCVWVCVNFELEEENDLLLVLGRVGIICAVLLSVRTGNKRH
jgi:hypothetical protein